MDSASLQRALFQQVKALVPNNFSFVDVIADLLGISPDSAYRRIRGEKSITLEEIQKIATHYHISIDALLSIESNSTIFHCDWLNNENFNFENYLRSLLERTVQISKCNEKKIYYEAKDFPPFHYFNFPELAAFKYFFWMRTILNDSGLRKTQFETVAKQCG